MEIIYNEVNTTAQETANEIEEDFHVQLHSQEEIPCHESVETTFNEVSFAIQETANEIQQDFSLSNSENSSHLKILFFSKNQEQSLITLHVTHDTTIEEIIEELKVSKL